MYTMKEVLMRTPKAWLLGYKPRALFDQGGRPPSEMEPVLTPKEEKRMGGCKETYGAYKPLNLPNSNSRKEQILVR